MAVAFHVIVFLHPFANTGKVDEYLPVPLRFLPGGVEIRYHGMPRRAFPTDVGGYLLFVTPQFFAQLHKSAEIL